MVREDNFDGVDRTHGNWRRTDFGIDHPFPTVKLSEKELFPYGVLEVKLTTKVGEEQPQWIRNLINSHLVEAATHSSASAGTTAPRSPAINPRSYHEPVSDGEEDTEYLVAAGDRTELDHLRLPPSATLQAREARHYRVQKLRDEGATRAYGSAESSATAAASGSGGWASPDDPIGLLSAACFAFTALLALAYSGCMYTYRIVKLRKRRAIDYHDRYGPTVLCFALVASVMGNLVLRLREL